jgi:transcription elongation factor GreA
MKRDMFLTPEGAAKLKHDLVGLRGPRRDEIASRLRHAIQQGDLSENADYISAKEDQAFLEGRIQELETILREATIVENEVSTGEVALGCTVVVAEEGGSPETYFLVGIKEADPRRGKISHESPIGQALMGKRPGDIVTATTPSGPLILRVLEVR